MMSEGSRSGVNWRRLNIPPSDVARVEARDVFPIPGGPVTRAWPRARRAVRSRSAARSEPRIVSLSVARRVWREAWSTSMSYLVTARGKIGNLQDENNTARGRFGRELL